VLRRVIGYRNEVICSNILKATFQSNVNKKDLVIDYYTHLSHYIIETLQGFSYDSEMLRNKVKAEDSLQKVLDSMDNKKRILLLSNHLGNWELVSMALPDLLSRRVYGVYKPLSNKSLNHEINANRERFGLRLAEMADVVKLIAQHEHEGSCYLFINDQSPPRSMRGSVHQFMGRDTVFYDSIEKLCLKYACEVYYIHVKPGEEDYTVSLEKIDSEYLKTYVEKLERDVNAYPGDWLWSHNRWKHNLS
jgi:KDO2-lipid IV(A) lauroyltransferase